MKTATIASAAPTATPTSVIWMIERFRTGRAGNHGPEANPNATVFGPEARLTWLQTKEEPLSWVSVPASSW